LVVTILIIKAAVLIIFVFQMIPKMENTNHIPTLNFMVLNIRYSKAKSLMECLIVWGTGRYHVVSVAGSGGLQL
ncbi:hypothetical protein AM593_07604, partial [Mytilus galloprovincialis]